MPKYLELGCVIVLAASGLHAAEIANLQNGFSHAFGGIIGEDILWRHEAILDLGGRALYLKPSP